MCIYKNEVELTRPPHLGGTVWHLENLNQITVVFGKNGSGKSVLLRAFRDKDPASYHYVCPERAGEISFQSGYLTDQIDGARRADKTKTNHVPEYRQLVITRINAYLTKRGARNSDSIPGKPNELEVFINQLMSEFKVEIPETAEPIYKLTRISNNQQVNAVINLSSGEAEVFTLAIDILTICAIWDIENKEQRILLIDEPDTHLHPDLQQRLAQFIIDVSTKYKTQVLIATHSTTLLSALGYHGKDWTSVIYLDNSIEKQKAIIFNDTLQELATCLGGHALMGPLFGAPLLLVEGDDEYKIWGQVPRYHTINLAVIPCNGEEIYRYQRTLEKVLSCILDSSASTRPSGFALLDGDKPKREENPDNPQKHIKYLKLACWESENLYLTNEVLADFGLTWETAKAKIKSESSKFGQKKDILDSVESWGDPMKTPNVKPVIKEIATILDPRDLPWTMRVAKCIGSRRPTGQLKDFLGDEVVDALWGPQVITPPPKSTADSSQT